MDQRVFRGYLCTLLGNMCRFSEECCRTVEEGMGGGGIREIRRVVKEFWGFYSDVLGRGMGTGLMEAAERSFRAIVQVLGRRIGIVDEE